MIVGIDLGTTNSLCAVFRDGVPQLIPNAHGQYLTPSVVGILDDGQLLVGSAARELQITQPQRCASRFKRYMGTDRQLQVADRRFSAIELSSLVLKSLKDDAQQHLGQTITEAVITVPAYFNDHQRKATKLAGEMAGLVVRRIINEPTAAALTYGFHDREAEKHLLVIDLGGGTFDVTLMEIFAGTLEIVSTSGESFLGGEDFTDRLAAAILRKQNVQLETAELKYPLRVARLRQQCELAKQKLHEGEQGEVRVPDNDGELHEKSPKVRIDRATFATVVRPLLDRLAKPIEKALRDGECPPEELDEVILVGGATRMRAFVDYVTDRLEHEPLSRFNPDEVVALGAAVQAALIEDDKAVDDIVMTDVCPFTLGVEVVKQFGSRMQDGYFTPVINRNTTIPVSREELFSTICENQSEVEIHVYQGESRKVKDNLLLGKLSVTGIPPGPAGTPVAVRFTYDLNGILEVEAFIEGTGKRFRTVLTQHASGMSPDEIEKAVRQLQSLKFYPRDDVANKELLLFCERVIKEINPHQRQQLEEAVDALEHAMQLGERETFYAVRDGLLMTLNSLGFHYEGDLSSPDEAG